MTEVPRQRSERRPDALSQARILDAAVVLLDEGGRDALTFRALAASLATGAGALYHHVANKGELLSAAASAAMTDVLRGESGADPADGIRAVASGVFDAMRTHRWLGPQLAAAPWQPAVLQLFERFGAQVAAIGLPERAQFDAASALVHHLLGVASQSDASQRLVGVTSRPAFLGSATAPLLSSADGEYPFLARIARTLVDHDDREQFLAGVDIILKGIERLRADDPDPRAGPASG